MYFKLCLILLLLQYLKGEKFVEAEREIYGTKVVATAKPQ